MKKSKVAKMEHDLPRTPKEAMAHKVDTVSSESDMSHEKSEADREREAEMDLDHLLHAEKIKGDSKRMEYVQKAADRKHKAIRSIADLKMAGQAIAAEKRKAVMGKK